jgi:hypothetical protein
MVVKGAPAYHGIYKGTGVLYDGRNVPSKTCLLQKQETISALLKTNHAPCTTQSTQHNNQPKTTLFTGKKIHQHKLKKYQHTNTPSIRSKAKKLVQKKPAKLIIKQPLIKPILKPEPIKKYIPEEKKVPERKPAPQKQPSNSTQDSHDTIIHDTVRHDTVIHDTVIHAAPLTEAQLTALPTSNSIDDVFNGTIIINPDDALLVDKTNTTAMPNNNDDHLQSIAGQVAHHWRCPKGMDRVHCSLSVTISKTGSAEKITIQNSSGNAAFDSAARLAIFKTHYPVTMYTKTIIMKF